MNSYIVYNPCPRKSTRAAANAHFPTIRLLSPIAELAPCPPQPRWGGRVCLSPGQCPNAQPRGLARPNQTRPSARRLDPGDWGEKIGGLELCDATNGPFSTAMPSRPSFHPLLPTMMRCLGNQSAIQGIQSANHRQSPPFLRMGRAAASVQAPSPWTWTRDGWSLLQKVVGLVEFWANCLYSSSHFLVEDPSHLSIHRHLFR